MFQLFQHQKNQNQNQNRSRKLTKVHALASPSSRQRTGVVQRAQRVVLRVRAFVEVLGRLPKEVEAAWIAHARLLASLQALFFARVGHSLEVGACLEGVAWVGVRVLGVNESVVKFVSLICLRQYNVIMCVFMC